MRRADFSALERDVSDGKGGGLIVTLMLTWW